MQALSKVALDTIDETDIPNRMQSEQSLYYQKLSR